MPKEFVRIKATEGEFPFTVRYNGFSLKTNKFGNEYLLLFGVDNKIYTVNGAIVVKTIKEHIEEIENTKGSMTFERAVSNKSKKPYIYISKINVEGHYTPMTKQLVITNEDTDKEE
ncbi:MAG: hypothetical protein QXI16_00135 [Sulfolobaceae archaeon]